MPPAGQKAGDRASTRDTTMRAVVMPAQWRAAALRARGDGYNLSAISRIAFAAWLRKHGYLTDQPKQADADTSAKAAAAS